MNGLSDPMLNGNWLLIIDYACTLQVPSTDHHSRNLTWDEQIPIDLQQQ